MGEHEDKQKRSYNIEINYKHSKGRYGRLPLDDVYTCNEFFKRVRKFEKIHSITLFHKFIQQFVNRGFTNPWKRINKILETPKTTLCNSKQMSLVAT
jgi:hypothetical protein